MARGFESKDVEYQQAEAERARTSAPVLTSAERDALEHRRTLLLSRARAEADLQAATSPAHRRMLELAIAALSDELARHLQDDVS